jgi:mRNA interferase MazF
MASIKVRRGELWWVALDPAAGSESKKTRPCLVVQRDAANAASPTTIVCPVTAAGSSAGDILNVIVEADSRLTKTSRVVCNQIRVVDLRRFGTRIGRVDEVTLDAATRGLRAILDI